MSADQQASSPPQSESVWDYPRPPALRRLNQTVQIELGGQRIAESDAAYEVLETSHPPTVYLPRSAFVEGALEPVKGRTMCEFKGQAAYFDVVGGEGNGQVRAPRAAWHYPTPVAIAMGAGMVPLILGWGGADPTFRQPMAIAVFGGLITSTMLSLVVIPTFYTFMDDIARLSKRPFGSNEHKQRGHTA